MVNGPLEGVRVLEFAGIGPGPFACMLLADYGADVVRITRPSAGDVNLDVMARGRTVVEADLKSSTGVDFVRSMAASADVLIEGFRPGVMERLGIGPDVLLALNPRLIYGRMTGYGQDGPMSNEAGHDINYIAVAGVLDGMRRAGERPVFPINLVGDMGGGGMLMALGVLAALLFAKTTGRGQIVDAAMTDGAALLSTMFHELHAQGSWREPGTNFIDSGAHFYDVYETSDGRFMAAGAIEPQFYEALVQRLGFDVADFPQFDRERWPEFKEIFASVFRGRTQAQWTEIFAGAEACTTPVLSMFDVSEHPQHQARASFVEIDGVKVPAPAPRFSETPASVTMSRRRSQNEALLAWSPKERGD